MHITLSKNPKLFEETNDLIEHSLNYPSKEKFAIDFYPVMNPDNFKNNHILIDQRTGKVIAHVGLNLREITGDGLNLPVALIGGVAVKREYRGKGLLKRLLNSVLNIYNNDVALFILWSDSLDLYKKFDFFPAGCFIDQSPCGDIPSNYHKTKFRNLGAKDFYQIKKIYSDIICRDYFCFKRSKAHWNMIKKMDSVDLYLKRDKLGSIESYFCLNKGGDLKGVVHEIGYTNKNQVFEELKSLRCWLPTLGVKDKELKFLGLFKMGNFHLLNKFLIARSNGQLRLIDFSNGLVIFEIKGARYRVSTEEFFQFIFGPFPPNEFDGIACKLFFSGLDSI